MMFSPKMSPAYPTVPLRRDEKGMMPLGRGPHFHQRSLTLRDKPSRRRPEQRYVHWSFESPVHTFYDLTDLKDLNNFFNWSMTYRLDSDFPVPYGEIQLVQHQTESERDDHFLFLRLSLYRREMN